jgi:hypothetical protein
MVHRSHDCGMAEFTDGIVLGPSAVSIPKGGIEHVSPTEHSGASRRLHRQLLFEEVSRAQRRDLIDQLGCRSEGDALDQARLTQDFDLAKPWR